MRSRTTIVTQMDNAVRSVKKVESVLPMFHGLQIELLLDIRDLLTRQSDNMAIIREDLAKHQEKLSD